MPEGLSSWFLVVFAVDSLLMVTRDHRRSLWASRCEEPGGQVGNNLSGQGACPGLVCSHLGQGRQETLWGTGMRVGRHGCRTPSRQ